MRVDIACLDPIDDEKIMESAIYNKRRPIVETFFLVKKVFIRLKFQNFI